MSSTVGAFRARLTKHANQLEFGHAKRWLAAHRLLVLHNHDDLHPALRDYLQYQRRHILAANLLRIQLFNEVLDALGPVPSAPLKGIALLDSLYRDDVSLRPMGDIDLLVPEEAIEEAISRLQRTPVLDLIETEPSLRLRRVLHHRNVAGKRGMIELHTCLGRALLPNSGWDTVAPSPATVHDQETHRLSPAVELVHQVVHFYKHRPFSCLEWADEIHLLCERIDDRSEREIVEVVSRFRCRTPFAVALELLRQASAERLLPSIDIDTLVTSPLRRSIHRSLFLTSTSTLNPQQRRHRLLEEIHAPLLADGLKDAAVEIARQAEGHFLARYPTRIPPGSH